MRIGGNISNGNDENNGNSNSREPNLAGIYSEIKILEPLFDKIMLIDPVEKQYIRVNSYNLENSGESCSEYCPLKYDKCGCICKDVTSNKENRTRFIFNKQVAYLVIGKPVHLRYKQYILVMIMKLDPSFQFGAYSETDAIDSITQVSSNLVMDPLTKIFNRKYLMDNITYMMKTAASQRKPLNLACIDVDNFKRFNDTYGHEFGDKVLQKVAELMSKSISVIDEAYPIRIGGDEFVIVGVGISKNRFKAVMNKLCLMVEDTKLPYENEKVGIKISIGVSEMITDHIETYKELYDKADTQLYAAKEAGKGCVR